VSTRGISKALNTRRRSLPFGVRVFDPVVHRDLLDDVLTCLVVDVDFAGRAAESTARVADGVGPWSAGGEGGLDAGRFVRVPRAFEVRRNGGG